MEKYIIIDWANNRMFPNKEFDSFEEGFNFLLERFKDEDLQDIFVIPKINS